MNSQPPSTTPPQAADKPDTRLRIKSEILFSNGPTVEIEHAGQCYLLRLTRENKLILTK